ncbi:type II toxin-antitoxin system RelE/ParE family toxin [Lysobacter brunescens]|uniref:Type II toxin-antitoxin system RelE/ParE family toxin n=1 Tax=Lysobacter brunescens TaxID=262323 RepID=A0ABW2YFN6_9GAMM
MNPRALRLRPQAAADIAHLADACAATAAGDGLRFIDAVDAVCARLAASPEIGVDRHRHVVPELPVALRTLHVPGFPHVLLCHMALPDAVEVIRVIDTTRGMETLAEDIAA